MAKLAKNDHNQIKIGDQPVVILPLEEYERMVEDLEMLNSKELPKKVKKARTQVERGEIFTPEELTEKLGL